MKSQFADVNTKGEDSPLLLDSVKKRLDIHPVGLFVMIQWKKQSRIKVLQCTNNKDNPLMTKA